MFITGIDLLGNRYVEFRTSAKKEEEKQDKPIVIHPNQGTLFNRQATFSF